MQKQIPDTSVRYHLHMIGVILSGRFVSFVAIHSSFIYGLIIGGLIGSFLTFFMVVGIPVFPIYDYTSSQTDVVNLPAQTDVEITDTELIGNSTSGFNFTGRIIATNVPVNQFECNLDNAGFGECKSPVKIADAEQGNHTFEVRSKLGNGTVDPTPAALIWNIK